MKTNYLTNLNNLLNAFRDFYQVKSPSAGITELEAEYKKNKSQYNHLDLDRIFVVIKPDFKLKATDDAKIRNLRNAVTTMFFALDTKQRELGANYPNYLHEFRNTIEKLFWEPLTKVSSEVKQMHKIIL